MTIRSILLRTAFFWGATSCTHAMTELQDFDTTPFQTHTTIRSEDFKIQTVPTKAGNVSILRSAEFNKDRPNVICMHYNSGCKEMFVKLFPFIRKSVNIVSIDLPGHGKSDDASTPHENYSFQGYARTVAEVADVLGFQEYVPVGISLGGHGAMEMMDLYPNQVKGIIITGAPAMSDVSEMMQAFNMEEMMKRGCLDQIGQATQFLREEATSFLKFGEIQDPLDFFVNAAMRTDGQARFLMMANLKQGIGFTNEKALLETCNIPVGIVIGKNDKGINADFIRESSKKYKNATILELDVGHNTVWNAPKEFSKFLLEFLDQHINGKI